MSSSSGRSISPEEGVGAWEPDEWDGSDSVTSSELESEAGPSRTSIEGSVNSGLRKIPLDVLVKAQRSVQRRLPTESSSLSQPSGSSASRKPRNAKERNTGEQDHPLERSSKNAPMVLSSKRQTSRARQVVDLPSSSSRDPRFASEPSQSVSRSIVPSVLRSEFDEISRALAVARRAEKTCPLVEKHKWSEECERLDRAHNRVRSRLDTIEQDERDRAALSEARKEEREKQKAGKAPWYLKKSQRKDILLHARFKALEEKGGKRAVRKAVEKKRRQVAGKEKKSRPDARARRQ
ncbi:hypothetical protein BD324DRAFT_623215 [Kockovaella imperatae]|uniref:rRNA biogenesis protein RRP36 n=1 Tax=Kockovaella imperatae TaxID=4999 RepID=A0A1Y1UJW1_9TREE|nr:hypothetical protein BD324DRAFT_623215 [Kockovaella imperatae]ORX37756.1 hypothetical protein BD324DRAFT_623215 [Kockovaella imperatae]